MLSVCIYCDTTPFYTEEEIMKENLCDVEFPDEIVKEWYEANKKELDTTTAYDLGIPIKECTFEKWFNEVSTAMDTDGLYDFAIERGFHPANPKLEQ